MSNEATLESLPGMALVVDDDPDMREALVEFLTTHGVETSTADSGREALEIIGDLKPGLIYLDLRLPDIGGLEVLERIRSEAGDALVVIISGHGGFKDAIRAMRLGAFDYLVKAEDWEEMESMLGYSLETCRKELLKRHRDRCRSSDLKMQVERRNHELVEANERLRREIDIRKAMEKELLEAKLTAETASQAKSEFLANMSHEIRTPIGNISGMAELLAGMSLEPLQREYLDHIREATQSLIVIVNDILDISQVEAGRLTLQSRAMNPRDRLERLVQIHRPIAERKGVALKVGVAEDVPDSISADPQRLGQVLENLISNAVKFTEQGVVWVGIELLDDESGGPRLLYSVSDTGIGIKPEDQKVIFQLFRQGDGSLSKNYQGTGLGLAICEKLVGMMGGHVWVESEFGRGSTFRFTVPCRPSRDGAEDESTDEVQTEAPSGLRIMLAEDNPTILKFIQFVLEDAGNTVVTAQDGPGALEILRQEPFDLVLMDIQLPEMDGVQITREVRKGHGPNRNTPFTALTAYAMKGDREYFLQAGMDGYLAKPIEMEALLDEVSRLSASK